MNKTNIWRQGTSRWVKFYPVRESNAIFFKSAKVANGPPLTFWAKYETMRQVKQSQAKRYFPEPKS